jgi:hypothetical protein
MTPVRKRSDDVTREERRMGHTPGFYRKLALLVLGKEVVRGGLCTLVMAALLIGGLSMWLSLILSLLAYGGLRLAAPFVGESLERGKQRATPQNDRAAYALCKSLRGEIRTLSTHVDDAQMTARLQNIAAWIDRILGVIEEDEKYQASAPLLDRLGSTHGLLIEYVKVARRGFDEAELRERVRDNLATLEKGYEQFWTHLNRDALVNLEVLSETIDFNLWELPGTNRRGGTS